MAQITDPISSVAAYVAYSVNGSSWTDISGVANQVSPDAQNRMNGVAYTFDGDTGLVTFGKREPLSVTFRLVYSEANAAWDALMDLFETAGGGTVYLRWAPDGNTASNLQYTTPATKISSGPYPAIDAGSGDPLMVEFTAGPVASITRATIT
jgi:hypothetical protein